MGGNQESTRQTATCAASSAGAENASERVGFLLRVVDGPDLGVAFPVDPAQPNPILVGTGPACELRLTDPAVSRRHVALDPQSSSLRLTDLGSKNGTSVQGVRALEVVLFGGEHVRLGNTILAVERLNSSASLSLATETSFGKVIGASDRMRRLYPLCLRLARTTVSVVIEGETGTGKELLAESLHEQGSRAAGPFVVFDCTAVPPSLVESVLFGHERGAFTGAIAAREGVFEQADGGTLFIDEIGDLDLSLQPKLLRAIQRKEVQRVGGDRWRKVDVRVIAATRRNLDHEVQEGRFREDLFFRMNVARIELPPLRERDGDVELLALHLWRSMGGPNSGLPPGLVRRIRGYAWPGNVRELENVVARYLSLGDLAETTPYPSAVVVPPPATPTPRADASPHDYLDEIVSSGLPIIPARERVVQEFERRYVRHVLAQHGGNVTRAAQASGVARRYFHEIKARTLATAPEDLATADRTPRRISK